MADRIVDVIVVVVVGVCWLSCCCPTYAVNGSADNGGCPLTQFRCSTTGRCVNLNVFCDGRNDCGDNSDEPSQCTHCNRTYYAAAATTGRLGESHRLVVTWPKQHQMPFTCYLTFASATQDPSELVQVRLDTATIGQYQSGRNELSARCPDGWMRLWDGNQRSTSPSGAWCGASITPRFYYSESTAVTLVLRLLSVPASLVQLNKATSQQPVLDLTYKLVPRSKATIRYGTNENRADLGESMPGTLCSRLFKNCATGNATCRIQSPGYPGIYPRNVQCLYRIAHRAVQTAPATTTTSTRNGGSVQFAFVLWQNDARKINLRDPEQPVLVQQTAATAPAKPRSYTAAECEASGDYISIYDGPTAASPLLARFCDGPLPEVTSTGPDVTVEFRSSPHDTIYAASTAIEGFELNVRVVQVTPQPATLPAVSSSEPGRCQVNVTSTGLSRGVLNQARQTWPPHTVCHFRFQARPDERVWIYFTKYYFAGPSRGSLSSSTSVRGVQCRNALRISEGDGVGWDPTTTNSSSSGGVRTANNVGGIIFCRDRPPPLCERHLTLLTAASNQSAGARPPPCLASESFLSDGSVLSVQQYLPDGTALTPWRYSLAYEFVRVGPSNADRSLSFPNRPDANGCDRLFVYSQMDVRGHVKSPQNVFLYGRGGSRQLRCVYRFQGDETMRVALEVTRLRLGSYAARHCRNAVDPFTHQRRCHSNGSSDGSSAFLQLQERPWGARGQVLTRDCLCDTALLPFRFVSSGSDVDVVFQVDDMNNGDDYQDFFFEIAYEFLSGMKCSSPSQLKPLQGPGSVIALESPRGATSAIGLNSCSRQSWLLQPRTGRFVFLSTIGHILNRTSAVDGDDSCSTRNRILVYTDAGRSVICPTNGVGDAPVHIFSPIASSEWLPTDVDQVAVKSIDEPAASGGSVVVEFFALQGASYQIKWLELTASKMSPLPHAAKPPASLPTQPVCPTWCPELKACIDGQLWCDGIYDCPSGLDESDQHCLAVDSGRKGVFWVFPKVYWYLVAAGSTLVVLFIIVSSVVVCRGTAGGATGSTKRLDAHQSDYELNGVATPSNGSRSRSNSSSNNKTPLTPITYGGSFRSPSQTAPLNDYQPSQPRSVLVRSTSFDKKLAVS